MKQHKPLQVGDVVISRAGRDRKRAFVVVGMIDADFVTVADGDCHKLEKPKKKRIKHLDARPEQIPALREALSGGAPVLDATVRKALETLGYRNQPEREA